MSYLEDKTISQSFLAKFNACPHSGLLYARHHDERNQTHAQARGDAFHSFAEWFFKEAVSSGEEMLPPDVAREQMELICDERTDLTINHHERDVLRGLAWNFAETQKVNLANPPATEIDAEMELGGYTIRGRIDWLTIVGERDAYIADWKTSLSPPSQQKFEEGTGAFQCKVYALLIAEMNPRIDTFHVAEMYPRIISKRCIPCGTYNKGHEEVCKECGEAEFDPPAMLPRKLILAKRELHDFKRTLLADLNKLDKARADDDWPASPGTHCPRCPARRECPLPKSELPPEITSLDEAVETAQNLDRLNEICDDVRESLKTFAVEEGVEIQYGDREWILQTVISNKADKKAYAKDRDAGKDVDLNDYVKPSFSTRFINRTIETEEAA